MQNKMHPQTPSDKIRPTTPKLSIIIAVYKEYDYLDLVLASIEQQHFRDFEVIIAEDNNDPNFKKILNDKKELLSFPINHVCQQDRGFRKNKILNSAIRASRGEYLVFIDGDCILHPLFLFEYSRLVVPGTCLFGRRVRLDRRTTQRLLKTKKTTHLSPLRLLLTRSKRQEDGFYLPFLPPPSKARNILGCNFCVWKKDMERINGFDEAFTTPLYGEDTDVGRRFKLAGVRMESSRFKAVQYHLHHSTGNRQQAWEISGALYRQKEREGRCFCRKGLIQNETLSR